jgi:hypothetical protein
MQMNFEEIKIRVKEIILNPLSEWEKIKSENQSTKGILKNYTIPLILLAGCCSIVGSLMFHMSFFNLSGSLLFASVLVIFLIALVYFTAWIINELAGGFGTKKNFDAALRLSAYANTAAYIAIAASVLIPLTGIEILLALSGFYSIYLFYTGLTPLLGTPADKKAGLSIASISITVVVFSICYWLILKILSSGNYGY